MGRRSRRPAPAVAPPRLPSPLSLVAVVLAPPPPVQAVWWTVPGSRTTPLAVAAPSGPVLAACPLAVAAGVAAGHSAAQARLRLPAVRIVPPDRAAAALLWEETLRALATVSPVVEAADPAGGVAYLDARGLDGVWGDAAAVARQALHALAGEGIGARAGVGPGRLAAQAMAWDMPASGPRTLEGDAARQAVDALPIDTPVLGLSARATLRLREVGVTTAGTLGRLPAAAVGLRFGAEGQEAWERVTGRPEPPLRPWSPPETLMVVRRDDDGGTDALALQGLVVAMGADLATGLAAGGQAAALLTLRLTCADGGRLVRSRERHPPLQASETMTATARDLLAALRPGAPVTEVALTAGDLCVPPTHQQGLWDDGRGRPAARLTTVLAAHERRYGRGGLQRLQRDPTATDGWRWLDLESADGPSGTDKGRGRGRVAGRDAAAWDTAGEPERGW